MQHKDKVKHTVQFYAYHAQTDYKDYLFTFKVDNLWHAKKLAANYNAKAAWFHTWRNGIKVNTDKLLRPYVRNERDKEQ